jgi:hypothetical protein
MRSHFKKCAHFTPKTPTIDRPEETLTIGSNAFNKRLA